MDVSCDEQLHPCDMVNWGMQNNAQQKEKEKKKKKNKDSKLSVLSTSNGNSWLHKPILKPL